MELVVIAKSIFSLILAALICLVATIGINAYMLTVENGAIISEGEAKELHDVDCIIVLGCLVKSDGTPSDMLTDRLKTGISLYDAGVSPKLLMSGDHGQIGRAHV